MRYRGPKLSSNAKMNSFVARKRSFAVNDESLKSSAANGVAIAMIEVPDISPFRTAATLG